MTKLAYMVVDARSSDPERMVEYRRLAQIAVAHYGGRYLEAARKFYDSPEYAAARAARAGVSDFDMLLAEAY